jgi:hypothetical protein
MRRVKGGLDRRDRDTILRTGRKIFSVKNLKKFCSNARNNLKLENCFQKIVSTKLQNNFPDFFRKITGTTLKHFTSITIFPKKMQSNQTLIIPPVNDG